jgi:hypothetical protein
MYEQNRDSNKEIEKNPKEHMVWHIFMTSPIDGTILYMFFRDMLFFSNFVEIHS